LLKRREQPFQKRGRKIDVVVQQNDEGGHARPNAVIASSGESSVFM
jgi:hypothetical protein